MLSIGGIWGNFEKSFIRAFPDKLDFQTVQLKMPKRQRMLKDESFAFEGVKPPKGSNVEGCEIFNNLLGYNNLPNDQPKASPDITFDFSSFPCTTTTEQEDCAISHVAGYLDKKLRVVIKCDDCLKSIIEQISENHNNNCAFLGTTVRSQPKLTTTMRRFLVWV
ncbi:hypothetical protein DMENIID0001_115070 [Sergentomyia squamirostris]